MSIAILTAGGIGSRTNLSVPKQFININDKPIIIYTLEAFQKHPNIEEIYVSILKGWENVLKAYAKQFGISKLRMIVVGGSTGQMSIFNSLKAIKEDHDTTDGLVVTVHDGNRPMVGQDIITDNIVKQRIYGSAVAVIPTNEVVFLSENGNDSIKSFDRKKMWRTQTPHSYFFDELFEIHNLAIEKGITDTVASCELMEKFGKKTYFSKGSEKNLKITTLEDLDIFKAFVMQGIPL